MNILLIMIFIIRIDIKYINGHKNIIIKNKFYNNKIIIKI